MTQPKFNLLDEPWIMVLNKDETVSEVSIKEVILNSNSIRRLAGETQTQNTAILRLLLAVCYTVIYRYDEEGTSNPVEDSDDALNRWKCIWKEGEFQAQPFDDYFENHYDDFWLIGSDFPFAQSKFAKVGTHFLASKLIGELSESNNKIRLFQNRSLEAKQSISFGEAARWLLFTIGYADVAGKPLKKNSDGTPKKKKDSPGVGWLGKIGQIYVQGDNLFETLMLNLVVIDRNYEIWPAMKPQWEQHSIGEERKKISPPQDPAALLTLRSRLILLNEENNHIVGYSLLGGDYFDKEDADIELYTQWERKGNKKIERKIAVPKPVDSNKQMWREFGNLVGLDNKEIDTVPGVIRWINFLLNKKLLRDDKMLNFINCSVLYNEKKSSFKDMTGDEIVISAGIFKNMDSVWQETILEQIGKCEEAAQKTGEFERNIYEAIGKNSETQLKKAVTHGADYFYELVDGPFRQWLAQVRVTSEESDISLEVEKWTNELKKVCVKAMNDISSDYANYDPFGRNVPKGDRNKQIMSIPLAERFYLSAVNKILKR